MHIFQCFTQKIEKTLWSPSKYQHVGHCGLFQSSDKGLKNCTAYINIFKMNIIASVMYLKINYNEKFSFEFFKALLVSKLEGNIFMPVGQD